MMHLLRALIGQPLLASALAAAVPISSYKSRTLPLPSGCKRELMKITKLFEPGSIHKLVPVKPV